MLTKKSQDIIKFFCENCQYKSSNKKDYEKHLLTSKHIRLTNSNDLSSELSMINNEFKCINCDKIYKSRVGLWKHKKICKKIFEDIDEDTIISNTNVQNLSSQITPELILSVLEQNKELTNLVVEQNKSIMELA